MGGSVRRAGRGTRAALAAALTVALAGAFVASPRGARADEPPSAEPDAEAFARVAVDHAEVRSGPGASHRVILDVPRGTTFAVLGRPSGGYWLRVRLDDGRVAYVLGDDVEVFQVRPGDPDPPSKPGFFAAPPLAGAHAGLAIVGGVLEAPVADGTRDVFGFLEVRPSWVVHPSLTVDGFVGSALTRDGTQTFYGGGATINVAPRWAICPFFGLGLGGLSVVPRTGSFVLAREDVALARAGGGLLFALAGRILVRAEATHLALFRPDDTRHALTVSLGLGVYF
jgi:hypothetical protein